MADPVRTGPAATRIRPPCSRPGTARVLLVLGLLLITPLSAAAQGAPAPEKLVAMRLEWLAQLARRDAADAQAAQAEAIELPSPAEGGRTVGNFQNPSVILKELRPVL
ncbi:MAG TPA: hypothetical protein VM529_21400, partial [Gemmata sp.]|nr:hypothetical protein [Gemmata sp.]